MEPTLSTLCTTPVTGILNVSAGAVGPATLITSASFGAQTIAVVVGFLPNPASLGDAYNAYAFLLVDPSTAKAVVNQLMVYLPTGEGTWAGTASIQTSTGTFPSNGLIMVFVSRSADGLLGPQVAAGTLVTATCTTTTS